VFRLGPLSAYDLLDCDAYQVVEPTTATRLAVDHLRDVASAAVVAGTDRRFASFLGSFVRAGEAPALPRATEATCA
jgi:hypothetical protein